MLMPIIAAVGSFVVSERILKPKATALVVLACLAVYDIFVAPPAHIDHSFPSTNATHAQHGAHDNSELDEFWEYDAHYSLEEDDLATSLRCYRGPALLAVALFCAAYSLRMWRRNGVAVDELIFLPGTPHEFRLTGGDKSTHGLESAGGIGDRGGTEDAPILLEGESTENTAVEGSPIKSCFSEGDAAGGAARPPLPLRTHSRSHGDITSVDPGLETPQVERQPLMLESGSSSAPTSSLFRSEGSPTSAPMTFIKDQALKGIDMLVVRKPFPPLPLSTQDGAAAGEPTAANNEMYDAEYAPSGPSVAGAALDLSLPVLFNFHMFVVLMKVHYRKEAEKYEEEELSNDAGDGKVDVKDSTFFKVPELPPKILPLFFITPLIIRSMVPPRQRRRFYKTLLSATVFSPFKAVRFRDAFVADCLTSLVRPVGDLVNALAYYWTVIFGLISGKYDLDRAGHIVSKSMLMHGLILPALSMMPLLIKFLQTLRQAFDTGKRWPYLGNAFKYYTAGLVILYGMTHTAGERSVWWVSSIVATTLYQIIWDVWIDWELLVYVPHEASRRRSGSKIAHQCRKFHRVWQRIKLRPKRLYEDDSYYWKALAFNIITRFCWMAGFMPAYRVSTTDGSMQVTFVDTLHGWSFVLLATIEIFRRSVWGIIKVELETIKLTSGEKDLSYASTADEYLREGKWKAPPRPKSSGQKSWAQRWRAGRGSVHAEQYSQLEQSEATLSSEQPKNVTEKETHRFLCFSVSSSFLRGMFFIELMLWPATFAVLAYYVVQLEEVHEKVRIEEQRYKLS
ncbi:hypothetical protein ACHAXT_004953 [Thalassiosira profunda]